MKSETPREISLDGQINRTSVGQVTSSLFRLNSLSDKPIKLFINSEGGSPAAALILHDIIRNSRSPVIGVVQIQVASVAVLVLQACRQRIAWPHAFVTVHPPFCDFRVCLDGRPLDRIMEQVRADIQRAQNQQEKIYQLFRERTGRSVPGLKRLFKQEERLSAQEALEEKLIDKIARQ